jgi:hypothetical protein
MAQGFIGQDINQNHSPNFPLQHAHKTGGGYYGREGKVTAQSSCSKIGSCWNSGVEFCATRF